MGGCIVADEHYHGDLQWWTDCFIPEAQKRRFGMLPRQARGRRCVLDVCQRTAAQAVRVPLSICLSSWCVKMLTDQQSVRGCSGPTGINEAGCFHVIDGNVTSKVCLCKRNYCNAASSGRVTSLVTMLIASITTTTDTLWSTGSISEIDVIFYR